MKKLLFVSIFLLFISNVFAENVRNKTVKTSANNRATYIVKIAENKPKFAFVESQIPVTKGRIFMSPIGADHLPNGWATFVENLQIKDESGKKLEFEKKDGANWQIANNYEGTAKLSYQVNLSFIYENWISGNEQAGAYFEDSIYLVTRPIFITSEFEGNHQITFDLPSNWKVSSPWKTTATKSFIAENQTDLLSNTFVVGNQKEIRLKEGNFSFILALPGKVQESSALVEATLKPILTAYQRLFNKTPPNIFLMTFFYANADDGEAYSRSAAFTSQDEITRNSLILWGNFLAHELFHFWNGQQIRGAERDNRQWFSEGFTEYFANLTLIREKLISEDLFIKKIEKHLALYLYFKSAPAFQGVSLVQAGARKGFNRPGVYNGGWTVAFCLDFLIKEKTSGKKTLDDFMRAMYENYGLTNKPYRYEDIIETASEVANHNFKPFFESYVSGTETIPLNDYLKKYGLEGYSKSYAGEVYLFKNPTSTNEERELFKKLISQNQNL